MFDIPTLIESAGYLGLFLIVFAETGLFFGFFLPGDSLLFTAGLLASQGHLNIFALLILLSLAAIIGDNIGYAFGKKVGPKLFIKEKSFFFKPENAERAKVFFGEYGKKAVVLARFIPIFRTFVPIIAGVGEMRYKWFIFYNIAGGIVWVFTMILGGYFLGRQVPDAENYLYPIIILIVIISFLPAIRHFRKNHKP